MDRRCRPSWGFADPVHPHREGQNPVGEGRRFDEPDDPLAERALLWYVHRPPQARPALPGQPPTYVTEISLPPTAEEIFKLAGIYGGEMALPVVSVAYLRQLPESRALILAMNRSPIAVKVRPVRRRASLVLRASPPAYVPMPEPVAFPQIKPGAEGEAA